MNNNKIDPKRDFNDIPSSDIKKQLGFVNKNMYEVNDRKQGVVDKIRMNYLS